MYTNNMTDLLNKIEMNLGTELLNLPEALQKQNWIKPLRLKTLPTFSRFFPYKIRYEVDTRTDKGRGNFYLIDEDRIPGDAKILGVRDIAWDDTASISVGITQQGYGVYDFMTSPYGLEDIGMAQMAADQVSLFNNNIFVEFEQPNRIILKSSTGADIGLGLGRFKVDLFLQHPESLLTIAPTMMETFEDLATTDVAQYLFNTLKYFDGLETIAGNIDLKMADLEDRAKRRDDIINYYKENYVSPANQNQPLWYTV